MKTEIGWTISGSGKITVFIGGSKPHSVDTDHVNYGTILSALRHKDYSNLENLLDVAKSVAKFTEGSASVLNGVVYYGGMEVHNSLTTRIVALMQQNMPFEPMIKFFENLMLNPSKRSVDELYGFLDVNNLPITEDGCFLAYKRVSADFKDMHTGTIDNSVGANPKMPRNMVDDDKDRTCSKGLHFCSFEYLKNFGTGNPIMVIKINPKDVVSIPTDYNNSKGRCCEYWVVAQSERPETEEIFDAPLYTAKGEDVQDDQDIYDEGYQAYDNGEYKDDVPYTIGTKSYDLWMKGFNDSSCLDGAIDPDDPDYPVDKVVTTYHNVRDERGRFVKGRTVPSKPKRDSLGRFC